MIPKPTITDTQRRAVMFRPSLSVNVNTITHLAHGLRYCDGRCQEASPCEEHGKKETNRITLLSERDVGRCNYEKMDVPFRLMACMTALPVRSVLMVKTMDTPLE